MLRSLKTTASTIALALVVSNAAVATDMNPGIAATAPGQQSIAPAAKGAQSPEAANAKAANNAQDQTAEKRKQITAEAMEAISQTRNALKALDEGKKEEALSALELTTGKLELILARDPQLELAPTNVVEITTSVLADIEKIKQVRREAQEALAAGRVQDARHLLQGLASETVIRVSNIPLGTYPDAIKRAAKLIDDDKQDEAKKTLQTALNTLVVTDTVIPLPVAATQAALKDAEKLAEKKDRSVDENTRLNALLATSRTELEFAEALGYGTKQDFRNMYAQLDEIKDKTSDGKSGTGFFAEITASLSDLFQSSQSPSVNKAVAQKLSDQPTAKQ